MKKKTSLIGGPCKWSQFLTFQLRWVRKVCNKGCRVACDAKKNSNLRPMITMWERRWLQHWWFHRKGVTCTANRFPIYRWMYIHSLVIMFWKVSQMVRGHHRPLQCNKPFNWRRRWCRWWWSRRWCNAPDTFYFQIPPHGSTLLEGSKWNIEIVWKAGITVSPGSPTCSLRIPQCWAFSFYGMWTNMILDDIWRDTMIT